MSRIILVAVYCLFFGLRIAAAGEVRRFVLSAGANRGGEEREVLRYAVGDAENFARVLEEMGGLDAGDCILLREPDVAGFHRALEELGARVTGTSREEGRTEVLLFYSGHADGEGLLLGDERLPYRSLRQALDKIPADVRIAVLDACASGAITRLKGGRRQPAFLMDDASDMRGYAFLTSSSEDETAQESDRIGASFFTHYLVSGLRGAADVSGDGKVTLGEAYQFAFHETLVRTTRTRGGAQHPKRDINMTGTGDVVITDLRQTSAGLLLVEELEGRFFIHSADQQLVAELYKPAGRSVELGLAPGTYEIQLEQKQDLFFATPELEEGQRLVLGPEHFGTAAREQTALRGGSFGVREKWTERLARRSRLEMRLGWWSRGVKDEAGEGKSGIVRTSIDTENFGATLSYAYWVQENLAVDLTLTGTGGSVDVGVGGGTHTETVSIGGILMGVRYYLPESTLTTSFRPYLSGAIGSFVGTRTASDVGWGVSTQVKTMGAFGGKIGGGMDFQLNRHFMLGAGAGYNLMTDFPETLGGRKNYSGFEMHIGVSWLFGKGVGR